MPQLDMFAYKSELVMFVIGLSGFYYVFDYYILPLVYRNIRISNWILNFSLLLSLKTSLVCEYMLKKDYFVARLKDSFNLRWMLSVMFKAWCSCYVAYMGFMGNEWNRELVKTLWFVFLNLFASYIWVVVCVNTCMFCGGNGI